MTQETALPKRHPAEVKNARNYQLDFLKFILAIFVFICHTTIFRGENTRYSWPSNLGAVAVQFFFVMSGLFMADSICKKPEDDLTPGKFAIQFILKKFNGVSLQYWTAMFIAVCISIYTNTHANDSDLMKSVCIILSRIFSEAFLMTNSGVVIEYNAPTWYLSAMFISMLPLAYLLYKRRDLFLHVLAPLIAVLILGFWCQTNEFVLADRQNDLIGVVLGGIIRAVCGLCFGVVAWLIYNKLNNTLRMKSQLLLVTVLEAFLWLIFFTVWLVLKDDKAIYAVQFILPIAVAITFSEKSYISRLFRFKWMRFFAPISLAIYLNHWSARAAVIQFFPDCSYKLGVSLMAAFTVMNCVLYYIIMWLCKMLWNKKLKPILTTPDPSRNS